MSRWWRLIGAFNIGAGAACSVVKTGWEFWANIACILIGIACIMSAD